MSQTIPSSSRQLTPSLPRKSRRTVAQASREQITRDLRTLGAVRYNFWVPETRALPNIIRSSERLVGVVYGRYKQILPARVGRGMLIATNERVLLVDKKPLFVHCDELPYRVVSGVSYSRVGLIGTVTLHNKLGDISVRTFNQKCAMYFVDAVEAMLFDEEERSLS